MTIKQTAIDAVAKAMALARHIGEEELPERDMHLYRERAELFLAAWLAVEDLEPGDIEDATEPEPASAEPAPETGLDAGVPGAVAPESVSAAQARNPDGTFAAA